MPVTTAEHRALWTAVRDVIEMGLVPAPELDAAFNLLEELAKQEKDSRKPYNIFLKINYFVGLWHCVNTSRKFDIYEEQKEFAAFIDGLAMKLAGFIDLYHSTKKAEDITEKASPNDVLNPRSKNSTTLKLLED